MDPNAACPARSAVGRDHRIGQIASNDYLMWVIEDLHANIGDWIDRGKLQTPAVPDKSGVPDRIINHVERPRAVRITAAKHRELVCIGPSRCRGRERVILLAIVGWLVGLRNKGAVVWKDQACRIIERDRHPAQQRSSTDI